MSDHLAETAGIFKRPNISDLQFRRHIRALHRLGERALAEFLVEIDADPHDISGRLALYAKLDPDAVRATGAAEFPPMVFPVAAPDGGDAA